MSELRPPAHDEAADCDGTATRDAIREAHVTVSDSNLDVIGIEDLVTLWREAGLQHFEALACHGTGAVVQVEVKRQLDEDRLEAIDCVDRWDHVSNQPGRQRYVVEFTAPNFPPSLADRADELIGTCDPEVDDDGVTMSLVGPQQAIADVIHEYRTAGLSPDLRKLGSYDGRKRPLETLTERQREVLETAYEMGYYEIPRSASAEDVAAELGVDASTVTEHLQRAERNLLTRHLSAVR